MLILCDQSKQAYTEAEMQDKMRKIKSLQPFMMKLKEKDNNPRICWILVRGGNILKWKGRIEYANIFMPQSHFFCWIFFFRMARLARSPTPRLEDYMYTAEPLNFAPALLIWLRFYQPHHRPLPSPHRPPVLSSTPPATRTPSSPGCRPLLPRQRSIHD